MEIRNPFIQVSLLLFSLHELRSLPIFLFTFLHLFHPLQSPEGETVSQIGMICYTKSGYKLPYEPIPITFTHISSHRFVTRRWVSLEDYPLYTQSLQTPPIFTTTDTKCHRILKIFRISDPHILDQLFWILQFWSQTYVKQLKNFPSTVS